MTFVRKIYDKMLALSEAKTAMFFLFLVAFAESSFFPIPPDLLLIPLVLATPNKAFKIAGYATVASVLGGYFGYAIGYFAYDTIAPHLSQSFINGVAKFSGWYNELGAWIVFFAGITPFPYKIITIASGVTHLDLAVFTVASVLARGIRFFLIAVLLWKWGAPMEKWIQKNLGWLSILFFVLLVGGFLILKWM